MLLRRSNAADTFGFECWYYFHILALQFVLKGAQDQQERAKKSAAPQLGTEKVSQARTTQTVGPHILQASSHHVLHDTKTWAKALRLATIKVDPTVHQSSLVNDTGDKPSSSVTASS